jgi:hypothetical protein
VRTRPDKSYTNDTGIQPAVDAVNRLRVCFWAAIWLATLDDAERRVAKGGDRPPKMDDGLNLQAASKNAFL